MVSTGDPRTHTVKNSFLSHENKCMDKVEIELLIYYENIIYLHHTYSRTYYA